MNIEYDAISPITKNLCVVIEVEPESNIGSQICMESGYTTTELLKYDSEYVTKHEEQLTELMIDAKFVDPETGLIWYPTFMQMPGVMLYPEGTAKELKWAVAKVIPVDGDERLKYPIPGKDGEYFTSRLDVDNANIYDTMDFQIALNDLYDIVKQTIDDEN